MQTLVSIFRSLGEVDLPFANRQHYMHKFDLAAPTVPEGFEDYLPIVKRLVAASGVKSGTAYLTVDEKVIPAGQSQRKPGPHVDGYFGGMSWGHGGGGSWNHYCNRIPIDRMPVIVAASVAGCKVYEGVYVAQPKDDGDLSHVDLPDGVLLPGGQAAFLSPDCIHESIRFDQDTQRSFLRIAMPVGSFQ